MALRIFYDKDADLGRLEGKTVAIIGYGSQGHAHAQNLQDSGVSVVVGLRKDSPTVAKAEGAGLTRADAGQAAHKARRRHADAPRRDHGARSTRSEIAPNLAAAATTSPWRTASTSTSARSCPPQDVNVFMVAPKGPGHTVRDAVRAGQGRAVRWSPSTPIPRATRSQIALAYAKGIGAGRAGIIETNFREETETDLFGEQAVLCGGLTALMTAGYETLVEAGYSPEMAYFECIHEVKLIVDLIYEGGIANMRYSVSNTAEYGDLTRGPRVIDAGTQGAHEGDPARDPDRSVREGVHPREPRRARPAFDALRRAGGRALSSRRSARRLRGPDAVAGGEAPGRPLAN